MIDLLNGKALYEKVDGLRKAKGWTLYELAKKSGVTATTLYNWRDRDSSPTLSLLDALCSALGITVLEFLADDEEIILADPALKELIEAWDPLKAEQKQYLIGLMRTMK